MDISQSGTESPDLTAAKKKKKQNDETQLVSVQKHEAAGSESGHRDEQGPKFWVFFCICRICN